MLSCSIHYPIFFQALEKIHLTNHIKSMAELLHAEVIQQLEVALLGSPAAHVIDLLSAGWMQMTLASKGTVICPLQAYTTTPVALSPPAILIVGVTSSLPVESVPVDESEAMVSDPQEVTPSIVIPKCCWISLTPIQSPKSPKPSSGPSTKSATYPILVVPKLTIPAEAHPKQLNQLGGGKEYQCQLCTFHHSNLNCILTHVRKHLVITIGCPMCGKRFQNAVSLHKHGRKVHKIQIVASAEEQ